MRTRTRLLLAPALALPLLLAACGGDDGGSSVEVPANPDLLVLAPGGLDFDADAYTVKAGPAVMVFDNRDSQSHNAVIFEARDPAAGMDSKKGEKLGGAEKVISGGRQEVAEIDLDPGTYLLVCTVPGHEAAGMKAVLTVG
jgi:plastocyanin